MRILLAANEPLTLSYSGSTRSNRALAAALVERGHEVHALVPALETPTKRTIADLQEELRAQGMSPKMDGGALSFRADGITVRAVIEPARLREELADEIVRFSPDWVLVSGEDASLGILEVALRQLPERVVFLVHTPTMLPFGPFSFHPGPSRTELVKRARLVVTISHFVAHYIREHAGIEAFVHHPPHYGAGPFTRLGRFDNELVMMMNASALKGVSILAGLARRFPGVRFGALEGWATTDADRALLSELPNVVWLPNARSRDELFSRARALLVPSLCAEGFGMAVVDAMLRGVPVLASKFGGLIEAKLGTSYLLPIRPIERFEARYDERMLPVPIVEETDLEPWRRALSELLTDRSRWALEAESSWRAANRFVHELNVAPLEAKLSALAAERGPERKSSAPKTPSKRALTPAQTSELILKLSEKRKQRSSDSFTFIERAPRTGPLPLSSAQQRIWFLERLHPGLYNFPCVYWLSGALDLAVLEKSINEIIRRHEALRTSFPVHDGQPVQHIAERLSISMSVVDLPSADEEAVKRRAAELSRRPFDLVEGPLIRATVLRLAKDEHVLLLELHHIVGDAWSGGVLDRELDLLYSAFLTRAPSPLPELAIQYVDFTLWKERWFGGQVRDKQVAYWKKRLAGAPQLVELPLDRPRPPRQTHAGSILELRLSDALAASVDEASKKSGATPFMVLLAGYFALLARYTGQMDLVVGSPIANRSQRQIEPLIGFFDNTLALRADLTDAPSYRALLEQCRRMCLEAYDHQDLPFEELIQALNPPRSLAYSPLVQTMFSLQNAARTVQRIGGLEARTFEPETGTSPYDLGFVLTANGPHLDCAVEFNSDLFDRATIERMVRHYDRLLSGLLQHPDRRIDDVDLLDEPERRQLVLEWNQTLRPRERGTLAHTLFEEVVERTPDAIAARCQEISSTYRALDERANGLAQRLAAFDLPPDALVGLMLERSIDMLVGLLGILKAGCAYLPLDPALPPERLKMMIADAGVRVVVCDAATYDRVRALDGALSVVEVGSKSPGESRPRRVRPDNLAYVIYTSGSTGKPKGVEIEHRSLVNLLLAMKSRIGARAEDVLVAVSPVSFDIATFELLLPLISGATVEIVRKDESMDGARLASRLASSGATMIHATPATFQTLLGSGWEGIKGLRIMTGGDLVPKDLADELLRVTACPHLWHLYGPTETTILACARRYAEGEKRLPLGDPLDNVRMYVLDRTLRPTPIGVPGEICVGGSNVARCYLGRPELSAEKFVPDPFSDRGERLYRTGDRGRRLANGDIEFLGRIDNQVKIRGFRIEVGEIEAVLVEHESVREAVVVAREEASKEKRLVAYVVASEGATPSLTELRAHLKDRLPEYMVPAAFVVLPSFPLSAHGKVNRAALPAPESGRLGVERAYSAPTGPIEEAMAEIWQSLLSVERVGVDDNFFELGGHSLLATKLVWRMREKLGVSVPLAMLFERPTIAELVRALDRAPPQDMPKPIARADVARPLVSGPLTLNQERMWQGVQKRPDNPTFILPIALRLEGPLDVRALCASISELAQRHEILRARVDPSKARPMQVVDRNRRIEVAVIDKHGLDPAEMDRESRRLVELEAATPFDVSVGPPLRASIVRFADDRHALFATVHHLFSDAVSIAVLQRELDVLYRASSSGMSSPLPPVPMQYIEHAAWERQRLDGKEGARQERYWRMNLAGYPGRTSMPGERALPKSETYRDRGGVLSIRPEVRRALVALSRARGATLPIIMCAGFRAVLFAVGRQSDLAFNTPLSVRNEPHTEGMVGYFVNHLMFRGQVGPGATFDQVLENERDIWRSALAHQDAQVWKALGPGPMPSEFYQIFYNFLPPTSTFRLGELQAQPIAGGDDPSGQAFFDLALYVADMEEQGLEAELRYKTDMFDDDFITDLLDRFGALLETMAREPGRRLEDALLGLDRTSVRLGL
jgi:amino acid adenylation domain-containing protein